MSNSKYGFFAKEVALKLEITPSTLRQWALALEEEGYIFERNDQKQRIYYDSDITALIDLKKLIEKKRSREDAIKAIAKGYKDRINAEKTLGVIGEKHDLDAFTKEEIKSYIDEAVKKAYEKGKEQGREETKEILLKIDERIERRDQHLIELLRTRQEETQKQIAAAQEESKKGFFSRLFKK